MVKAIPKFLHKTLKNTIGKLSKKIDANHIMNTKIRFEKNWSERHTVYRTIDYRSSTSESILTLLANWSDMPYGLEVDDIIAMLGDGRAQEAYDYIEAAIEEHRDYWFDEADSYGEEVDSEDHDSEYEDTIDSDMDNDVVLIEQTQEIQSIIHGLGQRASGAYQVPPQSDGVDRYARHGFNQPTFTKNAWINWLFGRRITPFSSHIQDRWLTQVEELEGSNQEAEMLREHLGEIDGS